jgi:O-antigen/teichoic acid export membrane protein
VGQTLLSLFGPEFTGAKIPLLILLACQLARALFGPNVPLLTVIGAQKQNAVLAVSALVVLAVSNLVLAPAYGVLGAATVAIALARLGGLRTDAVYLLGRFFSARQAPAQAAASTIVSTAPMSSASSAASSVAKT